MPTLLASCKRQKEKKCPVSCSDRPMDGIQSRVKGDEAYSSPKYPSESPAQAELLIPVLGAGEEPAQRSQTKRETGS